MEIDVRDEHDLLADVPVPIHRVDDAGVICWANAADLDLCGYAPVDYIGKPIRELFVDPTVADDIRARARAGEVVRDREAEIHAADGSVRRVLVTTNGQLEFLRDITERDALVEELQRTVRLNEMFAGVLGHDLRNPLNTIVIAGQVVLDSVRDAGAMRHLRRLLDSAGRMQRMIDQLLDFSGARMGGVLLERRHLDIAAIARDTIEELRIANPGRAIILDTHGDVSGDWDANRFAQVFSNLVGNAVQHGAVDAPVRIDIDGVSSELVRITVENRGTIPPDILPVVFEPFRGSHHRVVNTHGLGLGLFITDQIVQAHGGHISVTSRNDVTRFTIALPRHSDAPIASFDAPPERHSEPVIGVAMPAIPLESPWQAMLEAIEEYAIFMLDRAGRVASWNAGAARITGYRIDQIIGKHFSTFYPPEDVETGECERALAGATRGRYECEGWRLRKDGSAFWANAVLTALYDDAGTHVGFTNVTRDLTERRKAEEERLRLAQAREALRVRDEFLAIASHELKTPLMNLRLQLDTMLDRADDPSAPPSRAQLERAERAYVRLDELVATLLDVSHISSGRFELAFETTDLAELARAAIAKMERMAAGVGSSIRCTLAPHVTVCVDRGRVLQLVTNLVSNAIKYAAGKPIEIAVEREGTQALLVVRDHGPGIEPGAEHRLFERFEREPSSKNHGGLGLGLYLVAQIAKMHRGTATVSNAPDGGARFEVRLPMIQRS